WNLALDAPHTLGSKPAVLHRPRSKYCEKCFADGTAGGIASAAKARNRNDSRAQMSQRRRGTVGIGPWVHRLTQLALLLALSACSLDDRTLLLGSSGPQVDGAAGTAPDVDVDAGARPDASDSSSSSDGLPDSGTDRSDARPVSDGGCVHLDVNGNPDCDNTLV